MVLIEDSMESRSLIMRGIKRKTSLRFGRDFAMPVGLSQILQVDSALNTVAVFELDANVWNYVLPLDDRHTMSLADLFFEFGVA